MDFRIGDVRILNKINQKQMLLKLKEIIPTFRPDSLIQ